MLPITPTTYPKYKLVCITLIEHCKKKGYWLHGKGFKSHYYLISGYICEEIRTNKESLQFTSHVTGFAVPIRKSFLFLLHTKQFVLYNK